MLIQMVAAGLGGLVAGGSMGFLLYRSRERALQAELRVRERELAEQARKDLEVHREKVNASAREDTARTRAEMDRQAEEQRRRLNDIDDRLREREAAVNRQLDRFGVQEQELRQRNEQIDAIRTQLEAERAEVDRKGQLRKAQLEQLAHTTASEAREQLMREVVAF